MNDLDFLNELRKRLEDLESRGQDSRGSARDREVRAQQRQGKIKAYTSLLAWVAWTVEDRAD